MAIIKGEIESLKRIKRELRMNEITRFSSVGDLKQFMKNYEKERIKLTEDVEKSIDEQIILLKEEYEEHIDSLENSHFMQSKRVAQIIVKLIQELQVIEQSIDNSSKNSKKWATWIFRKISKALRYVYQRILDREKQLILDKVDAITTRLEDYAVNKELIITTRSIPFINELERTKEVVNGLTSLILGAIGENKVVSEIKKLPDTFILFNDFSLLFDKPIYNKKEHDWIYSIQIDHLLVSNAGVFIIETKNWSTKSIENLDLRSPVQQVKRTSYALFIIFNSDSSELSSRLNHHHWGVKKVPIRNLIVMINTKPKEKFNYVEVRTLKELTSYIMHFEPIFTDEEVISISEYLEAMCAT